MIVASPFTKKTKKTMNSILTSLNSVEETIRDIENIPSDFSYQKIIGESIIKELPNFPYLYYPESKGVEYKKIYVELKSNLIKETRIGDILKQFCEYFSPDKTEIIHKIIHRDTYKLLIEPEEEEENINNTTIINTSNSDSDDSDDSLGDFEEA
jgi:hypothetical protein